MTIFYGLGTVLFTYIGSLIHITTLGGKYYDYYYYFYKDENIEVKWNLVACPLNKCWERIKAQVCMTSKMVPLTAVVFPLYYTAKPFSLHHVVTNLLLIFAGPLNVLLSTMLSKHAFKSEYKVENEWSSFVIETESVISMI